MPGLIAFNRRWGIGSDDFVFPTIAELVLRVLWFVPVLIILLKHKAHLSCEVGQQLLQMYLTVLLIGLSLIILLDTLIAIVSSKGTITQTRPRRHLSKLLYLRLLIAIAEVVWNGIGTKWAFTTSDHNCVAKDVVIIIQIVVVCSWMLIASMFLGMFLVFDPVGSPSQAVARHRVGDMDRGEQQTVYVNLSNASVERARRVWEWRMRIFCCCSKPWNEDNKNAYSEIAKLFAEYFEDIDLIPSDIAAGLILLHQRQLKEIVAARVSTSHQSENLSVQSPDSLTSTGAIQGSVLSSPGVFTPIAQQFWMNVEMALHFMKFSKGSYGWPMFLFSRGLSGACKLLNEINDFLLVLFCACKWINGWELELSREQ